MGDTSTSASPSVSTVTSVYATSLRERGTGGCRTVPYDVDHHRRNVAKQFRNKQNRARRADANKGGKAR